MMREPLHSKFLQETIRYHKERGRDLGIHRCELWLCSSEDDEVLYRWTPKSNRWPVPPKPRKDINVPDVVNNSEAAASSSEASQETNILRKKKLMEERVVKCLWSNETSWVRPYGGLVQELTTESSHIRSYGSVVKMLQGARAQRSPLRWIVSIPIGAWHPASHKGMVFWIGDPAELSSSGQKDVDLSEFLESATRHIDQTYRHESQFAIFSSERKITNSIYDDDSEDYDSLYGDDSKDPESQSKNKTKSARKGDEYNDGDDITPPSDSKLQVYFRKYKGRGEKGPMPLCWRQVLFTFVGSFFTIFFICIANRLITSNYMNDQPSQISQLNATNMTTSEFLRAIYDDYSTDDEWEAFEMGPFGATCVLVFAMTSAAPSQPKVMLFGASIGMIIGKVVGYLDLIGVGIGVRMSLSVALSASIMAVTANLYPPGAALAIIFTSRLLGWERFILQAIGTVLTFSLGVIINNLHPLRTYPNFWLGFEPKDLCKKPSLNSRKGDGDGRGSACRSIM